MLLPGDAARTYPKPDQIRVARSRYFPFILVIAAVGDKAAENLILTFRTSQLGVSAQVNKALYVVTVKVVQQEALSCVKVSRCSGGFGPYLFVSCPRVADLVEVLQGWSPGILPRVGGASAC